jgi:hypothetical protein
MKKRIVACMLMISLLFYLGCYNTTRLTKEELAVKDRLPDISVVTNDGKKYEFEERKYHIFNDSLTGFGVQKLRPPLSDIRFRGSIPLDSICVIEMKELSPAKSVLLAGGVGLAVAGIIALSNGGKESAPPPPPSSGGMKMSCPFIYSYDGSEYYLESETFAGAVLRGLERSAFDVLYRIKPVNGSCRIKLVNARQETEYVNELRLYAVDHPLGTAIIPDRIGTMHTITHPVCPTTCVDLNGNSVANEVTQEDHWYWNSDLRDRDWNDPKNFRDGLIVEFPKPANSQTVKLVVNGKNTHLGYFALAKIFALKGNRKAEWYSLLENDTTELASFARWLMREGMLHVQLWEQGKWVEKAALLDVGPGIAKSQVAILDISSMTDDMLKIRLECTTDLWQIDQVYVDYSPDVPVHAVELELKGAINELGQDVAHLLTASDEEYYTTVNDQYADLEFADTPQLPGTQRSYVAKTMGFYYQWLASEGPAQNELVQQILSEPGAGTRIFMPEWLKEQSKNHAVAETR